MTFSYFFLLVNYLSSILQFKSRTIHQWNNDGQIDRETFTFFSSLCPFFLFLSVLKTAIFCTDCNLWTFKYSAVRIKSEESNEIRVSIHNKMVINHVFKARTFQLWRMAFSTFRTKYIFIIFRSDKSWETHFKIHSIQTSHTRETMRTRPQQQQRCLQIYYIWMKNFRSFWVWSVDCIHRRSGRLPLFISTAELIGFGWKVFSILLFVADILFDLNRIIWCIGWKLYAICLCSVLTNNKSNNANVRKLICTNRR